MTSYKMNFDDAPLSNTANSSVVGGFGDEREEENVRLVKFANDSATISNNNGNENNEFISQYNSKDNEILPEIEQSNDNNNNNDEGVDKELDPKDYYYNKSKFGRICKPYACLCVANHRIKHKLATSPIFKVIVSGAGFLADAYDLFIISLVIPVMGKIYPETLGDSSSVSTAALVGAIFGQLFFGFLADCIGRKIGFIMTLSLVMFGALASAFVTNAIPGFSIFLMLSVTRFILGFGIGGEYPLSASVSAEGTTGQLRGKKNASAEEIAKNDKLNRTRGSKVAAVFSMQGIGSFLAPLVIFFLLLVFPAADLDYVWRIALGLGLLPGFVIMYFRLILEETLHTKKKKKNVPKTPNGALPDPNVVSPTPTPFTKRSIFHKLRSSRIRLIMSYWKRLLGTAGTWFLLDITFYANGLFYPTIIEITGLGGNGGDDIFSIRQELINSAKLSMIISFMGIPGYWVAVLLIDKMGRKTMQIMGFAVTGYLYILIGTFFNDLIVYPYLFLFLYGLTFFFSNFGANTTTFVLPAESFPARIRATCHGFSAAAGKLGAFLGGALFKPLVQYQGLTVTLVICGCISFAGLILTIFCIDETSGKALEEEVEHQDLPSKSGELILSDVPRRN